MENNNMQEQVIPSVERKDGDITYCSFNRTTMAGKIKLANSTGEATFKAQALKDYVAVKDVVRHIVPVKGVLCERTVLIMDDGDTVGFVSEGIVKEINKLISIFGPPTWIPPLNIKVVEVPTTQGNTYNIKIKE